MHIIIKHFLIIYLLILIIYIIFKCIFLRLNKTSFFEIFFEKDYLSYLFLDIVFFIFLSIFIQNIIYNFEIAKFFNIYIHTKINYSLNLTFLFIISNIIILLYFFIRFKLPGKAWELILTNKHSKNLDTFMVVIGLIFAASFGAITSFDIDSSYFESNSLIIFVFFVFISINIIIMTILVFLSTYVINTMGNRKPIMFMIVFMIGISLLTQETLNFHSEYKKYLKIHKTGDLNAIIKK